MLPGFMLMLLCAWGYAAFIAGASGLAGTLLVVQGVVLAVIVRAVQRNGKHVLVVPLLVVLASVSALATLVGVPFRAPPCGSGTDLLARSSVNPNRGDSNRAGGTCLINSR